MNLYGLIAVSNHNRRAPDMVLLYKTAESVWVEASILLPGDRVVSKCWLIPCASVEELQEALRYTEDPITPAVSQIRGVWRPTKLFMALEDLAASSAQNP